VRQLSFALDAVCALREATRKSHSLLAAAATLAEIAGAESLRLSFDETRERVGDEDLRELRRCARRLELQMPPAQAGLKLALEVRPDRVVLAGSVWSGVREAAALDLRGAGSALAPMLRSLEEAGIVVVARVSPEPDAVKAAHGLGFRGVELFSGGLIDLPADERRRELNHLADAVRLASKLRLSVSLGGSLGYASVAELLAAAPGIERVACGRALVERSLLVGLDRAVRDFLALLR